MCLLSLLLVVFAIQILLCSQIFFFMSICVLYWDAHKNDTLALSFCCDREYMHLTHLMAGNRQG